MGKRSATASDKARRVVDGTFTAAAQTSGNPSIPANAGEPLFTGNFHVTIGGSGWTGTVKLQRSFDGGATWVDVAADGSGTVASYTGPCSVDVNEFEDEVLYRLNCTALSAGTIPYRISQ